jgi:RNA polymerase sigma-54 factor
MHLNLSPQMRMSQEHIMAPHMIQSMEILQLNALALQEKIEQELEDNPLLENENAPAEDGEFEGESEFRDIDGPSDDEKELVVDSDQNNENDFERLLEISQEWPDDNVITAGNPSSNRLSDLMDRRDDMMANAEGRPETLSEHLIEQLSFFDLPADRQQFAEYLIHNLDDDGRLPSPLAELVQVYPGAISLEDAEQVLTLVQKLDPPGIAARDLKECWLLQIEPNHPQREVLITLVTAHMDDLAHRRMPQIQRKTGYSLESIKQAVETLRTFNAFPGRSFRDVPVQRVTPDMVVEKNEDGKYSVRLLDEYVPALRISPRYAEMLRNGTDAGTREFIKKKLESAKWLIDSIEQRYQTMQRVAQAIVDFQTDFFEYGPEHIAPLKMQQVADVVKVHVTTVSRAVSDKWLQSARGLFPLRGFFGGGTQTADGEEIAHDAIRLKLKEIVESEDKSNPLSDEALMNELQNQGYPLARRTVTKYRKIMNIPSSRHRRGF